MTANIATSETVIITRAWPRWCGERLISELDRRLGAGGKVYGRKGPHGPDSRPKQANGGLERVNRRDPDLSVGSAAVVLRRKLCSAGKQRLQGSGSHGRDADAHRDCQLGRNQTDSGVLNTSGNGPHRRSATIWGDPAGGA